MLGGFGFWVDCQKIKIAHPNHSGGQACRLVNATGSQVKKIARKYEGKKCNNYCDEGEVTNYPEIYSHQSSHLIIIIVV